MIIDLETIILRKHRKREINGWNLHTEDIVGCQEAIVTPLFKKGSKAKPENYRPVSSTCILEKLLESIIKDYISVHLDSFKLISRSQHGFSKGRSCLTNFS